MQQRENPAINQGDEHTPKYNSSYGGGQLSTANLQSHSLQTGTAIDEGKQEIIDEIGKATGVLAKIMNDVLLTKADKLKKEDLLTQVRIPANAAIEIVPNSVLGFGGFGTVHFGIYDNKKVAIKSLKSEDGKPMPASVLAAVENEVLLMHYLGPNPNILTCFGIWKDPQAISHIVLDYAPYSSLAEIIYDETNFPDLPLRLRLAWLGDLISAIDFIHSKGVKHRDIKAENLLVFHELSLKLCDFGLSKQHSLSQARSRASTALVGTDGFMSPEVRSNRGSSLSSDIYSFALTVFQLILRSYPPASVSHTQLIENVIIFLQDEWEEETAQIDIEGLQSLLLECIAENPTTRPPARLVKERFKELLMAMGGDPRLGKTDSDQAMIAELEAVLKRLKQTGKKETPSPIPSLKPVPTPAPHPTPVPEPSPAPSPDNPAPPLPPHPSPSPSPDEPNPYPGPGPTPVPPLPEPKPKPSPNPNPSQDNPTPIPNPGPSPPHPSPNPGPNPRPGPDDPTPGPSPKPKPSPNPVDEPDPKPVPGPSPVDPEPSPRPRPDDPSPEPGPKPGPFVPEPTPSPNPSPNDNPPPKPNPGPSPNPVPGPGPVEPDPRPIPGPSPVDPEPSPKPDDPSPSPRPNPGPDEPLPHSSVPGIKPTEDPIEETVDVRTLSMEEAVELLVSLGCPESIRQAVKKPFDGVILCLIETVDELIDECHLTDMRKPIVRGMLLELQRLKTNGLPKSQLESLREIIRQRAEAEAERQREYIRQRDEKARQERLAAEKWQREQEEIRRYNEEQQRLRQAKQQSAMCYGMSREAHHNFYDSFGIDFYLGVPVGDWCSHCKFCGAKWKFTC